MIWIWSFYPDAVNDRTIECFSRDGSSAPFWILHWYRISHSRQCIFVFPPCQFLTERLGQSRLCGFDKIFISEEINE